MRSRIGAIVCLLGVLTGSGLVFGAGVPAQQVIPKPNPYKGGLSSSVLRSDVALRASTGRSALSTSPESGRLRVEVLHRLPSATIRDRIEKLGGTVEGEVAGHLVQALVPWSKLEDLESSEGVWFLRPPTEFRSLPEEQASGQAVSAAATGGVVVGDEVAKMNADDWHAAGLTGKGAKVAIVDFFSTDVWTKAQTAGEVPAPVGTSCHHRAASCDVFTVNGSGHEHGTAVAEIVHEMAPDAQIYLGWGSTIADLAAVVGDFQSQGIKIVSQSLGAAYESEGNGTGPFATIVDDAVSNGMTWFNAVGNSGGGDSGPGGYYRAKFRDTNNDGFHEFATGDQTLGVPCGAFSTGLRWDDWSESNSKVTDFDLYLLDGNSQPVDTSENKQGSSGGSFAPLENFSGDAIKCPGNVGNIAIHRFASGSSADDVIEFHAQGMEYWSNPYSAAVPFADSANIGEISVGSIDPAKGTTVGSYTSRGPTTDNRTKPDIAAPSCIRSFTYAANDCFHGTSSSTPAAAGAAALVVGAGLAATPIDLAKYVLAHTVDRATAGPDNDSGRGEFVLPSPLRSTITVGDVSVAEGAVAKFTFTAAPAAPAAITLTVRTSDGSAASTSDYAALPQTTVTLPAGMTTATADVQTTQDTVDEADETFNLDISSSSANAAVADARGIATITDDDLEPRRTVTVNDVRVNEGSPATFTLTATNPTAGQATVDVTASDGTAMAATGDYTTTSKTVTIPAGAPSATVDVPTPTDALPDPGETFNIDLTTTSPTTTVIGDPRGQATIIDAQTPLRSISVDDVQVDEGGAATFTVSATNPASGPATADVATSADTANAGTDYSAFITSITIPTGIPTVTVSASTVDDAAVEPKESFFVDLANQSANATIGDARGQATVADNEVVVDLPSPTPTPSATPKPTPSRSPSIALSPASVAPGQHTTVTGNNFDPAAVVGVGLRTDPDPVGALVVGETGNFSLQVLIPRNTAAGPNTMEVFLPPRVVLASTSITVAGSTATPPASAVGATATAEPSSLPQTGVDVIRMVAAAMCAIALGMALERFSRWRRRFSR